MRSLGLTLAFGLGVGLQLACDDAARPTQPDASFKRSEAAGLGAVKAGGGSVRLISIHDACDSATFPVECTRNGGVAFGKFLELLGQHHSVGAWHFAPTVVNAKVGQTLLAVNRGGEDHTFTEVEEFGGGMIPELNELSGNPVPAPECLSLGPGDIIEQGATASDEVEGAGTELYQCCIHPWMRLTVHAR